MHLIIAKYYKLFWTISISLFIIITLSLFQTSIRITYSTDNTGSLKLYYTANGESFCEDQSIVTNIENHSDSLTTATFLLWSNSLTGLRIDIPEISKFQLHEVGIYKFGRIIEIYNSSNITERFSITNDIVQNYSNSTLTLTITGSDPYIGIQNIPQGSRLISFILKLYFMSFLVILLLIFLCKLKTYSFYFTKESILISLFLSILILPTLFATLLHYEAEASLENATIHEKPTFSSDTLQDFPTLYNSYYEDTLPYKQHFVMLSNYIDFYLFNKSGSEKVIKGKDDWLFLTETVADFEGSNLYTEKELINIASNLTAIEEELNNQGIAFYVFIAPNKNTIYGEYMPNSYIDSTDTTKASELVSYLKKNTELCVIYPEKELLEYKANDLYYKWDTHWNAQGAYIGFTTLAEAMGITNVAEYTPSYFEGSESSSGDLKNMLQIKLTGTNIDYGTNYKNEINIYDLYDNNNRDYLKYGSNSGNPQKLLVFRDSFSSSLIPYLSKSFDESVFIWDNFSMKQVNAESPDFVVYEVVERYTDKFS